MHGRWLWLLLALCLPARAGATGEGTNGFPSWEERVLQEWVNRARVDPATALAGCTQCGEAACYQPMSPLSFALPLNRAARFHSDELVEQGYFDHPSHCPVVSNIDALYPGSCQGQASCACAASGSNTSPGDRVALFGSKWTGEIIAGAANPDAAFTAWITEESPSTTCEFSQSNGHRWLILKAVGSLGMGVHVGGPYGLDATGDFSGVTGSAKVPSGAHSPRQAASVEAWTNWSAAAGPQSAQVDLEGTCQDLTLRRGTATNGAWAATLTGVGTGCHRYYFVFKDSTGAPVTYPTQGSLGIGASEASCPIWSSARPGLGPSCDAAPVVDAGTPDAGVDAGTVTDAGVDAGTHEDAGTGADAGVDAGTPDDAGVDAGSLADAGAAGDAGVDADAGVDGGVGNPDGGASGSPDAGLDGGPTDTGGNGADAGGGLDPDGGAGTGRPLSDAIGGCGASPSGAGWLGLMGLAVLLGVWRSRRAQR